MAELLLTPGQLDISITNGDSLYQLVTFTDIDLTDYEFESYVFRSVGAPDSRYPITVVVTDEPNGQISIALTAEEVSAIGVGKRAWLLQWVTSVGETRTMLSGNFNILQPK